MNIEYNPKKNHDAISILKQEDGNFIGYAYKFGKVVSARQSDPVIVLQLLLTHDGKDEDKISL